MTDTITLLLLILVIEIAFLYMWMREKLNQIGRIYPLLNPSFKIYADFISVSKERPASKKEFNTIIINLILVWIGALITLLIK